MNTQAILGVMGRNTFWLWLDLAALRLGTLLAGLFLMRYLGPGNYGIYSTALAGGWLASAVVDLGLTRYAGRAVAGDAREAPSILALSILATVFSVSLQILALFTALHFGKWFAACICVGLVLNNFEGTASLCSSILTARFRARDVLTGSLLGAASLILIVTLVIWQHLSVLELLAAVTIKSLLVATVRLVQLRSLWPARQHWRWSQLRRTVGNAGPFFSYSLTQVGYIRVLIVCLGLVASHEQVGWFTAAFVIADVFPQWSYASVNALIPMLTRLFEESRMDELINLRQRLLDVLVYLSVPVVVLLAALAPDICLMFGPGFAHSSPVLRIVAYRSLFSVLDGFLGHGFLIALNRVNERQRAQMKCVVLLGIATLVLGHRWGSNGAAVGLFLGDSLLIIQYRSIFSKIGLKIRWPSIWSSLVAGTAMALTAVKLAPSVEWVLRPVPALFVYFAVLALIARTRLIDAGRTVKQCFAGD